jgi:hypothetical protein
MRDSTLIPILAGALLGGLFALLAGRRGGAGGVRLFALGLVITALIYVVLALPGADRRWLAIEAAGAAVFAGLAWLGARTSLWWLAVGWVAHVAWDVGLHLDRAQPVVGEWYPLLCVGFELVVAGFLLNLAVVRRPSSVEAV